MTQLSGILDQLRINEEENCILSARENFEELEKYEGG